jgi:cobalt transporter subunit CbtB
MSTLRETISQLTQTQAVVVPWSKVIGIGAAVFMGMLIVTAVGFAAPEIIHNAAHDLRHGLAFPCH